MTPEEIARLHALPDDALVTPAEAAEVLRLQLNTLNFYRCNRPGYGPKFVRVGGRIRYAMGALREYATYKEMPAALRRKAALALAARLAKEPSHG